MSELLRTLKLSVLLYLVLSRLHLQLLQRRVLAALLRCGLMVPAAD
jgi:hypothetical protein